MISEPEDVSLELLHIEMVSHLIETHKDKAISELELIGFNTGYRLIEKLTRETTKFKDELELMKFICKDFWSSVFKKPINNLRTNHHGIYVLQDNNFKFLNKISDGRQHLEYAPRFLAFTCGLLRGSLANLGIVTVVTADVSVMPSCKFQVKLQEN